MQIKAVPRFVRRCEKCGSNQIAICNTRDYGYLYRRRKCLECGARFTTIEITIDEYNKLVERKNDGKSSVRSSSCSADVVVGQ